MGKMAEELLVHISELRLTVSGLEDCHILAKTIQYNVELKHLLGAFDQLVDRLGVVPFGIGQDGER